MPFTFSHPAFILPFITKQRKWLSVTGLVVGSIVPDFEYFLRMEKGYPYFSHSASSLFYFNLPFGVLLCFLFHGVVRDPLVQNLPNFLRKRFIGVKRMNWMPYFKKHWIQICLSILLGALTHIGWDRFLHVSSDFLYEQQERLSGFVNWQSPSFIYLLNHTIHSLLGLLAIGLFIFKLPSSNETPYNDDWQYYWLPCFINTLIIFSFRLFVSYKFGEDDMIAALIASFLISLTGISYYYNRKAIAY